MARVKGLDDGVLSNVAEDEEVSETDRQHGIDDNVVHEDNDEVSETSYEEDENNEYNNEVLEKNDSEDEINEDNNEDSDEVGNDSNVAHQNVVLLKGISQDNMFFMRCVHNINKDICHDNSRTNPNTHTVVVALPRTLADNKPVLKHVENVKKKIQKLN